MHDPQEPVAGSAPFSIGECLVDPGANRISGPAGECQIEPKAMQVLCVLARRQGQTVSREALLEAVWVGRVVVDETLTRAVSLLRQAFQRAASQSGYIQTVPKQGYRLTVPVGDAEPAATVREDESAAPAARQSAVPLPVWALGLLLLLAVAGGLARWLLLDGGEAADAGGITSVAVLPFERLDESDETAYLAAGVAEELINALASVSGLRVPSRHSSFAFETTDDSLADIAAALDVRHMLEGSVRRSGDAIRINARLIDVDSDTTLWSRQYEGELANIFAVEEEIASGVITALRGLSAVGDLGDSFARTPSMDAYTFYLQGQYWWMNGTTGKWFYQARDAFEQAVALDPNFAEAHASLAYIYARHDFHDFYMPRDIARERSAESIERALSLDAQAVDAYVARAILATADNHFARAREALDTALEIAPENPVSHYIDSELQLARNNPEGALAAAERALALDPLSAWVNVNLGIVHYYRGEYELAAAAIDEAIRIDPEYTWAYVWKTMVRHAQGRLADAVVTLRECLALDPASESNATLMGLLYLDLMEVERAQEWFERAASLQGDDSSARLWRRMTDLAYRRTDDDMLLALAGNAVDELHNSRYSLLPIIRSAYAGTERQAEAVELLSAMLPGVAGAAVHVQPRDGAAALAMAVLDPSTPGLRAGIAEAIESFPSDYRRRGLAAQWQLLEGREQAALRSLTAALDEGWLTHWWMLPQVLAFEDPERAEDFQELLNRARAHAREEAAKLAALPE